MSTIGSDLTYGLQLDPKTAGLLGHFNRRRRALLGLRATAAAFVVFILSMSVVAICDYVWLLGDPLRWLLSGFGYAATAATIWWYGVRPIGKGNAKTVARQIESTDSRLRDDLLSAVELADPRTANGSPRLRTWLQRNVADRTSGLEISQLLPIGLIQRWLLAVALIAIFAAVLLVVPKVQFGRRIARAMLPGVSIERASLTHVSIVKPSPPAGFVAEGDAVAVLVQISGRAARDVIMQWRNTDGVEAETIMTPRLTSMAIETGDTLDHQDLYAANLSVGTTAVSYRILAGDAVTLWHTLTPLPRPRVEIFRKDLEFPSYSRLPDRVEQADHGDLKALVGTKAKVTFRFDEAVDEATIRYGNRGNSIKLEAVEGADREYVATIPIRTPGTYQVDAISRRSGLNNPFSPQYSIVPIRDTPPIVRWSETTPRSMIVSPLDVVTLQASVQDDLPIDRVIQEFQISGQPVLTRQIELVASDRELNLSWDWDLLRRGNEETSSMQLQSGDIIRTRIVAIDRKGQRGESNLIELLIAEEGFDTDRHARLEEIKQVTTQVADWASRLAQWMKTLPDLTKSAGSDDRDQANQTSRDFQNESVSILERIARTCEQSTTLAEAGILEIIGRAVADLANEQSDWVAGFETAMDQQQASWETKREAILRDHANLASRYANDALRLEQYAKHAFGEELTVGLLSDAISLRKSLVPLIDEEARIPAARFPRYLVVTMGRLRAIDEMIQEHADAIPESTSRHLENWNRWSDSWYERLRAAVEEPPREDALNALIAQFDTEIQNQIRNGMIDGRLASSLQSLLRELRIQIGPGSDLVRLMAKRGIEGERAAERLKGPLDSETSILHRKDQQFAEASFSQARQHLGNRLQREEMLHRSRPKVDLRFAADIQLMNRAMENVAKDGYAAYRDEPAASVYQNLAMAFQVIEAKHEADQWFAELLQLMVAERRLSATAITKIKHASWLERISAGLEWPARTLQNAGIPWQSLEAIDRTRYNDDFNEARDRITSRRWDDRSLLSAEASLERLQTALAESLDALEPKVIEAREILQRYVLSLPEQAREAAKESKEAQKRTESRSDSEATTADQLAEQQQRVEQATQETLQSLVDLANTASLIDSEERELARDADIAASQIQRAAELAEESINKATQADNDQQRSERLDQTAEALEQLSGILEQTASHFEKAESGEDLAESREQLRQAEAEMQEQDALQERYDQAESIAEAAQATPEEMLRQLEEQLQDNQPMQQELSEIARQAAETAQRTLEQAAQRENELNQSLERSDTSFQEQKQRVSKKISSLAQRTASINESLLQAGARAIALANAKELEPKIQQVREQLQNAVNEANQQTGEQALLTDIEQAAANMAEAIDSAKQTLEDLKQQTDAAEQQDVHKDDSSRRRAQSQLDRFARDARSRQLRDANTEKQQWSAAKQQAGRRIQDAQRRQRDEENKKRQFQQQLDRDPKQADALQPQIDAAQSRLDQAAKAERAAQQSRDFAEAENKAVEAREQQIKGQTIKPLEQPNPAAELASQMGEQANQELGSIREELDQLAQDMDFKNQLRAPQSQSEQLADRQQRIQRDVNEATEQLRRAARHEQRLGQQELSEQLDAVAQTVEQTAAAAAQQAAESLRQAATQPEASPQANQNVTQAAEQIQQSADQLAQMLSQSMPQAAQTPTSQNPDENANQQSGRELAQTLDELDRQLASQQQSSQQQPSGQQQPGQQDTASSQSSGTDPAGAEGQQEGQQESNTSGQSGEAMTAQEASPTLANSVDAQSQQAARQRQEQLSPSQSQGGQQGESTSQSASTSTGTEPGSGEMPGGGPVDISDIVRNGDQWGQLRQQRTEDIHEAKGPRIAPQYRQEIEAYFRAIARRAAEKAEREKQK